MSNPFDGHSNRRPGYDPSENPYAGQPAPQGYGALQSQQTSALAIMSLVSGIAGLPMSCCCGIFNVFALFAIVGGHVSRNIMRTSNGRVTGDGAATTGLVLGYISMALSVAIFAFSLAGNVAFQGGPGQPWRVRPPAAPVPAERPIAPEADLAAATEEQAATLERVRLASGAASGNNETAEGLAQHFAETWAELALRAGQGLTAEAPEEGTEVAAPEDATRSEVPVCTVHCRLQGDRCVFVVGFSGAETSPAAELSRDHDVLWLIANRTTDRLEQPPHTAVAVVTDVAVTVLSKSEHDGREFDERSGSNALLKWFRPSPE